MAILLTIHVQNQLHETVRTFVEPPGEPFLKFCRAATTLGVRYVDFIWPYADAMLNFFQLAAWMEDFPRVLDSDVLSPEESASSRRVLEAAKEAHAIDGYLFIEG
ncbi:hypothetical protein [Sinomonas mesophila]|uniref:hypothetical protein n=1 Tax=Sinomonas mesophila TaxID=1531955 RepID=UPI000984CC00|nr:hypothetical protein [Sinomonas mesophila]